MNKKRALGIVVAFVLAGGYWWISSRSQMPDAGGNGAINIADWKTYRNEEYGFEVKYPSNWSSLEKENAIFFDPNPFPIIEGDADIKATVIIAITPPENFGQRIEQIKNTLALTNFEEKEVNLGQIAGRQITGLITGESPARGNYYRAVFFVGVDEGSSYGMSYQHLTQDYVDVFEGIVSSFRFVAS